MPANLPRRFHLQRHRDVSGVSGTGRVAVGVQWPDGTASVRWLGERPSTVVWDSMDDAEHVHGHGGATEIVWDDEEQPAVPAQRAPEAARATADTITDDELDALYERVAATQARSEELRSTLVRVLSHFTERGHPGEPCLRTPWLTEKAVARWQAALQPPATKEQHGSSGT